MERTREGGISPRFSDCISMQIRWLYTAGFASPAGLRIITGSAATALHSNIIISLPHTRTKCEHTPGFDLSDRLIREGPTCNFAPVVPRTVGLSLDSHQIYSQVGALTKLQFYREKFN